MPIPHAIPYQGSKRKLAPAILPYIPTDTLRLVELFAGSGALSIAAASSGKAQSFWLNDANTALMALWDALLNQPEKLADRYEILWHRQLKNERHYYDLVRDRFNKTHRPYYFLYLLARCVKASVRYNADGEFNQSPDNRRKGKRPVTMRKDILATADLLAEHTTLSSADYTILIHRLKPSDVIYLDPPYQGVSNSRDPRYLHALDEKQFIHVLEQMNERDLSYIVSYDGRTGNKSFGKMLPTYLNLHHLELDAGRSSQATLLGRKANTVESLYLSAALVKRLPHIHQQPIQYELDLKYG